MLNTKYITLEDFKIVDVAIHCDYSKLNIAIQDAVNFELPEILCEYYGFVKSILEVENPNEEQLKILNGVDYECGSTIKRFLGIKALLVYYSYANYLMGSTLNDSGLGFVQKTDQYSIPTPLKDIKEITNSYRNRGYSVFKQLKDYLCHNSDLIDGFDIHLEDCGCGCSHGNCDFTEKRIYTFKPRIIKKYI